MSITSERSKYVFCDTSTVTIPRIAQLMLMSIQQEPYRYLKFKKMEIFDEFSILSSRVRGVSNTSYKTSADRDSKYTLTYIDGQLVEINDLVAERTIFRNMADHIFVFAGRDYTKLTKYWIDPDELVYRMEESGEYLRFGAEVVNYIRQHPDELLPYAIDDEGILTIPPEYMELLLPDYTQQEYEQIVSSLKKPLGVSSSFADWDE
jgi:hypothetical protein